MLTRKHQRKIKWYKLLLKYEVMEMSRRLLIASALCGAVLSVAPMAGIAEPTTASLVTEQELEKEIGTVGKGWIIIKGAGSQIKNVYQSVTGVDERLIRKDEQLKLAKVKILELKREIAEKKFVSGLKLDSAQACVGVIDNFFKTQVEGK
jgi:hypothetical protein